MEDNEAKDKVYSFSNLKEAFLKFKFCYLANAAKVIKIEGIDDKSNYYCGITHNLDERQGSHKNPEYVTTAKCDSFETAKELEKMLHDEGFDTGRKPGVGKKDSVFVYMYKKVPGLTNESNIVG